MDKEYSNIHDANSCLAWIPKLDHVDKDLNNMVTDDKRHLMLSDIAGLPVGHAARELTPCFRTVLDAEGIGLCRSIWGTNTKFIPMA